MLPAAKFDFRILNLAVVNARASNCDEREGWVSVSFRHTICHGIPDISPSRLYVHPYNMSRNSRYFPVKIIRASIQYVTEFPIFPHRDSTCIHHLAWASFPVDVLAQV